MALLPLAAPQCALNPYPPPPPLECGRAEALRQDSLSQQGEVLAVAHAQMTVMERIERQKKLDEVRACGCMHGGLGGAR